MLKHFLPKLSDSYSGFCGKARWGLPPHGPPQKTPRLRRRPRGFENLLTGSVGRLCRGVLFSGAFCQYLSGLAAVATAGEEIAAAHAEADPIGPQCESTESLNLGSIKFAARVDRKYSLFVSNCEINIQPLSCSQDMDTVPQDMWKGSVQAAQIDPPHARPRISPLCLQGLGLDYQKGN